MSLPLRAASPPAEPAGPDFTTTVRLAMGERAAVGDVEALTRILQEHHANPSAIGPALAEANIRLTSDQIAGIMAGANMLGVTADDDSRRAFIAALTPPEPSPALRTTTPPVPPTTTASTPPRSGPGGAGIGSPPREQPPGGGQPPGGQTPPGGGVGGGGGGGQNGNQNNQATASPSGASGSGGSGSGSGSGGAKKSSGTALTVPTMAAPSKAGVDASTLLGKGTDSKGDSVAAVAAVVGAISANGTAANASLAGLTEQLKWGQNAMAQILANRGIPGPVAGPGGVAVASNAPVVSTGAAGGTAAGVHGFMASDRLVGGVGNNSETGAGVGSASGGVVGSSPSARFLISQSGETVAAPVAQRLPASDPGRVRVFDDTYGTRSGDTGESVSLRKGGVVEGSSEVSGGGGHRGGQ